MSYTLVLAQTLLLILFSPHEASSDSPVRTPIRSVSISLDGKLVAAGSGTTNQGVVTVWDLATHKPRWTNRSPVGISRVQFAPSGQSVAVASNRDQVRVFDVVDGKVQHTLRGNGEGLRALAFAPDSKFLAVAGTGSIIRIWNLTTGELERTFENSKRSLSGLAFSPNGKILAASGSGGVALWDIATGQIKTKLPDYLYYPVAIAFTPDGSRIVVGCSDAKIVVWNIDANREEFAFHNRGGVMGLAYDHHHDTVVTCSVGGEITLIDLLLRMPNDGETKRITELLAQLDDDSYPVREKADREFLTIGPIAQAALADAEANSASLEVRIRSRRIRSKILSTPRAILEGDAEQVFCVSCSPATGMVASGGNDGIVKLWDIQSGKLLFQLVPSSP
jgi:WD40 repeat protein